MGHTGSPWLHQHLRAQLHIMFPYMMACYKAVERHIDF